MLLAVATPTQLLAEDRLTARLDPLLHRLHEQGAFNGAVAVTVQGKTVYARSFGLADQEAGVLFTPQTASDGASLAKPVTAAAVLLLVAEGRLDLDAPVTRHVSEFPHAATTIRHLMSHSGALPDYDSFQPLLNSGRPVSTLDLLRDLHRRNITPAFTPGSDFGYCNLCYDTLALVVERLSGETYQSFVQRRLLFPAGARASFVRPARFADWTGVRTRGYRWTPAGVELFDALDNGGFYGGGNIYFTTQDLAAWTAGWSRSRALPRGALETALTTARVGTGPTGLTLGNWYCAAQGRRCYYTGHHQGFHNFAYWDAGRRLSVVFMSNDTLTMPLQMSLPRALIAVAEGRQPEVLVPELASRSEQVDPAPASGVYRAGDGRTLEVRLHDGRLLLRVDGGPTYRLYPAGWGRFYAPGLDCSISFAELRDGVFHGLSWDSIFQRFTARRI